jgi:hypothetical protein
VPQTATTTTTTAATTQLDAWLKLNGSCPVLQELAAADPSVHAALGDRSALAVRRGSEAEEVVGFSFLFGFFFSPFLLGWWVGRLMCLFGCPDIFV